MNDVTQFFDTTGGGSGPPQPPTSYNIERSLRFNSSDSAYLSRVAGSPTASGTWTFSVWVKRSKLGTDTAIFGGRSGSLATQVYFKSDNTLRWYENGADFSTTAVFRDVSSWYHFVFTKNGSSSCTIYVNGVQLQQNISSVPSTSPFNTSSAELFLGAIGLIPSGVSFYGDLYLADIHFIDGQALDPTSFGEFDTNGVWQPKAYTGTYPGNSFHLPFSDNSSAAALGTDTSGNSNTWTVNNISVAAGSGNDSLVDSPTNYGTDTGAGGEVRGNYCTLNPLAKNTNVTLSNGNLDFYGGSRPAGVTGTIGVSSGKWYYEINPTAGPYNPPTIYFGFAHVNSFSLPASGYTFLLPGVYSYTPRGGYKQINGTQTSTGFGDGYLGSTFGIALDLDNGTLEIYEDGSLLGTIATGLSGTFVPLVYADTASAGDTVNLNFGQRPFAYTAPSGYKALCTANLPTPTIADGSTAMDVALYTGNGSTLSVSNLSFEPDFLWFKRRNSTGANLLFDAIRGRDHGLISNTTASEYTSNAGTDLVSIDSTGFTVGPTNQFVMNANGGTYAAWTWDAGSSTVTNTDGSITSSVRANPSAGFSIVTFTGTGSNATVGHGLGIPPSVYIIKKRSGTGGWFYFTTSIDGSVDYLSLDSTGAASSAGLNYATAPTSTVFSLGVPSGSMNDSGSTYVAYCFAPVEGYSAFGSYTGNGSADGPFVYTGFRPAFVLIKRTDAASLVGWYLWDSKRAGYNDQNNTLNANTTGAEYSSTATISLLSNGFKLADNYADRNTSGATYIYAAFAESPFKYSRAR